MTQAIRARQWRASIAHLNQFAADALVETVCGYGESVPRVLVSLAGVFVAFMAFYGIVGGVVLNVNDPAGGHPTTAPVNLLLFTMTAMLAPGSHPKGLEPANAQVLVVSLLQSFLSIFLIGLLGFVAGNRIRR